MIVNCDVSNRSMVYALSFRGAHKLGTKDGLDRVRWIVT